MSDLPFRRVRLKRVFHNQRRRQQCPNSAKYHQREQSHHGDRHSCTAMLRKDSESRVRAAL
jgi:hypothetical protein